MESCAVHSGSGAFLHESAVTRSMYVTLMHTSSTEMPWKHLLLVCTYQ